MYSELHYLLLFFFALEMEQLPSIKPGTEQTLVHTLSLYLPPRSLSALMITNTTFRKEHEKEINEDYFWIRKLEILLDAPISCELAEWFGPEIWKRIYLEISEEIDRRGYRPGQDYLSLSPEVLRQYLIYLTRDNYVSIDTIRFVVHMLDYTPEEEQAELAFAIDNDLWLLTKVLLERTNSLPTEKDVDRILTQVVIERQVELLWILLEDGRFNPAPRAEELLYEIHHTQDKRGIQIIALLISDPRVRAVLNQQLLLDLQQKVDNYAAQNQM